MSKKMPEEDNPISGSGSFLTRRQIEVLRLRCQGRTQQEIAEIMDTTRPNVTKLERRAYQNIMMARRTIRYWMKIQAPISLTICKDTDVLHIPAMIFEAADIKGIHLPVNSIDLIVQLKAKAPFLFNRETLPNDVTIFVSRDGQLLLIDSTF
jgi:Tfx family DNA-binding protein